MAIRPSGNNYQPLDTTPEEPEDKRSFFDRIKSDVSRITAGNIDDPKSEAYKKYGAGRNAVKADVPVPAAPAEKPKPQIAASPPAKPRPTERALTDPMYSDTGSKTGMGAAGTKYDTVRRNASEPRPADALDLPPLPAMTKFPETESAKNKPRIVSKKELEDSGFDNLRDYLNDQKGLSRKSSDKHAEARKNLSSGKKRIDEGGKPYRSGGSVSSASSRADGIAQRGKTRGRMR
jgi:hypothetical protein